MAKQQFFKKYSFVIILAAILAAFFALAYLLVEFWVMGIVEDSLKEVKSETEDMPVFVLYDTLYSESGKMDVDGICEEEGYVFEEVLAADSEKAYVVCKQPESYNWIIASIDFETKEIQEYGEMNAPSEHYTSFSDQGNYQEQNGFYCEGKIVLNDHEKVLTYDLDSGIVDMYDYNKYDFPEQTIGCEVIDAQTICLQRGTSEEIVSLKSMSLESEEIAKIFEMQNQKMWSGDSKLQHFFSSDSVWAFGNEIYAIGECRNFHGYASMALLKYEENAERWIYVTGMRTPGGDIVHGRCYVVPQVQE